VKLKQMLKGDAHKQYKELSAEFRELVDRKPLTPKDKKRIEKLQVSRKALLNKVLNK